MTFETHEYWSNVKTWVNLVYTRNYKKEYQKSHYSYIYIHALISMKEPAKKMDIEHSSC